MLDWLSIVRLADVEAIRWALAGLKGGCTEQPVTIRRANQWIARMAETGLVDRVRPMYRDRQIVWPTRNATGRSAPKLFRQTMRHELAVATVAARYIARGFIWTRDGDTAHQADGIATRAHEREAVEVELTVKKLARYKTIYGHFGQQLSKGELSRVSYFCTPEVGRLISREADRFVFRDQRPNVVTNSVLTDQGNWIADAEADWG